MTIVWPTEGEQMKIVLDRGENLDLVFPDGTHLNVEVTSDSVSAVTNSGKIIYDVSIDELPLET